MLQADRNKQTVITPHSIAIQIYTPNCLDALSHPLLTLRAHPARQSPAIHTAITKFPHCSTQSDTSTPCPTGHRLLQRVPARSCYVTSLLEHVSAHVFMSASMPLAKRPVGFTQRREPQNNIYLDRRALASEGARWEWWTSVGMSFGYR
jgi:hypothetical protein